MEAVDTSLTKGQRFKVMGINAIDLFKLDTGYVDKRVARDDS
jgi:hypothetical protein